MDRRVRIESRSGSHGEGEGSIAADESDSVAQNGITRARGFRQRRKEEQIRRRTERRKNKRAARNKGQQCEQPDCDEAIHVDIGSPDQARRTVLQQPFQSQVSEEYADVIEVSAFGARGKLRNPDLADPMNGTPIAGV